MRLKSKEQEKLRRVKSTWPSVHRFPPALAAAPPGAGRRRWSPAACSPSRREDLGARVWAAARPPAWWLVESGRACCLWSGRVWHSGRDRASCVRGCERAKVVGCCISYGHLTDIFFAQIPGYSPEYRCIPPAPPLIITQILNISNNHCSQYLKSLFISKVK
jgi:hypothetical protein